MKRTNTIILIIIFFLLLLSKFNLWQNDIKNNPYQTFSVIHFKIPNIDKFNDYMNIHQQSASFIPSQTIIGDTLWLYSIQYIGSNIFKSYYSGLFDNLDTITDMDPYRSKPYIFGEIVLPINKHSSIDTKLKTKSWKEAITLGEKGRKFLCNKSGCKDYRIASYLGFNYFLYFKDLIRSVNNYDLASTSPKAPDKLKQMPAIITSRLGNNIIGAILRYQQAQDTDTQKEYNYFINKAISELIIDIIKTADNTQNKCNKDLSCLIKNHFLQSEIENRVKLCMSSNTTGQENIVCSLLFEAIRQKYIDPKSGTLIYPTDSKSFVYGWRYDMNERWIIPQKRN